VRDQRRRAILVVPLLLVACGGGSQDAIPSADGDATATSVDGGRLVAALCDTQALAHEPDAATRAFQTGAHGPLHELAASVTDVDRRAAAQLHEAKQRAEAALAAGDSRDIDTTVALLTSEARASLESLGQSPPTCDETGP
jgi:hypothetical protein